MAIGRAGFQVWVRNSCIVKFEKTIKHPATGYIKVRLYKSGNRSGQKAEFENPWRVGGI